MFLKNPHTPPSEKQLYQNKLIWKNAVFTEFKNCFLSNLVG
jgi:hypothetical protein